MVPTLVDHHMRLLVASFTNKVGILEIKTRANLTANILLFYFVLFYYILFYFWVEWMSFNGLQIILIAGPALFYSGLVNSAPLNFP